MQVLLLTPIHLTPHIDPISFNPSIICDCGKGWTTGYLTTKMGGGGLKWGRIEIRSFLIPRIYLLRIYIAVTLKFQYRSPQRKRKVFKFLQLRDKTVLYRVKTKV